MADGPHITAAGITMAVLGDTVDLECTVDAQPEPKMLFWKDASGWMPVIQGGQYNINVNKVRDVSIGLASTLPAPCLLPEGVADRCSRRLSWHFAGGEQVDHEADHQQDQGDGRGRVLLPR